MADSKIKDQVAKLSFEDALQELEGIVRGLEEGRGKLDDAITSYERGVLLKTHCEQKLAEAKMKIDKVVADGGNGPKVEPLDGE